MRNFVSRPIFVKVLSSFFGVIALMALPASATISTYQGSDPKAGPGDPIPNSNAAALQFTTAAAANGIVASSITFEDQATGGVTGLTVATGVTLNTTGNTSGGVQSASSSDNAGIGFGTDVGYNTTPGGSQAYQVVGDYGGTVNLTFAFASPVSAFGAYLTGVEPGFGTLSLQFDDGSSQSLPITGNKGGGAQYFGFTDPGKSISSISLVEQDTVGSRDLFAIDDVTVAHVPEPASLGLLSIAGVSLLARRRRA